MDRVVNPFSPGAGVQPPELVGRAQLLDDFTVDLRRLVAGRPVNNVMLRGLRGVGKTVLLNRFFAFAASDAIVSTKLEAPEDGELPQMLGPEFKRMLYELDVRSSAKEKIHRAMALLQNFASAFKIKLGDFEFGVERVPGEADTGVIEQDLPRLIIAVADAALQEKRAVVLFIDEVQYLSQSDLSALIVACHEASQRSLPLLFVGAGLPQITALTGNAKSYSERLFSFPEIDGLDEASAREAIVRPLERAKASIEERALDAVVRETHGYPYFLQLWGFEIWNRASGSVIREDDVLASRESTLRLLDANFFRVRFDRLTPSQQRYLRAMAEIGPGPYKTKEIADVIGVQSSSVAPLRAQLIRKGMVWSRRHGETAFTVPMFDDFMRRAMPEFAPPTKSASR